VQNIEYKKLSKDEKLLVDLITKLSCPPKATTRLFDILKMGVDATRYALQWQKTVDKGENVGVMLP